MMEKNLYPEIPKEKFAFIHKDERIHDEKLQTKSISYLGDGNDNLKTLANGKLLWRDPMPDMSERILDYISSFGRLGLPVNPDPTPRFVREVVIDNK